MESNTTYSKFTTSLAYLVVVLALMIISSLNRFLSSGLILWINELIIFTIPILWVTKRKNLAWKEICHLKPISKSVYQLSVIIGFTVYPVFMVLSSIVEVILNETLGQYYELTSFMETIQSTGLNFFLFITGVMILAPIFEELFFRGFLQNGFGGYKHKRGWVLAGFLFGAIHFANHISNAIAAIFLGLLLSYIAFRTKSIWPTIIIHGIVNILSATLLHIPNYLGFSLDLSLLFSPITVGIAISILIICLRRLPPALDEFSQPKPFGIKAIIPILITLLLFGLIAVAEINNRISAPRLEASTITAIEVDKGLLIANINVETDNVDLYLEYSLEATSLNGYLTLLSENGTEVWAAKTETGQQLTIQSSFTLQQLPADTYSLWLLGSAEDLNIDIKWRITELL